MDENRERKEENRGDKETRRQGDKKNMRASGRVDERTSGRADEADTHPPTRLPAYSPTSPLTPHSSPSVQHDIHMTELAYSAAAVGRIDGMVTFVKGGAPDEKARVEITETKKRHQYAQIVTITSPSPARCPPPCSYFNVGCGGCQWQHINVAAQLTAKQQILVETLRRIGKQTDFPPPTLHAAHEALAYRNKIRLTITSVRPHVQFGFKQEGSHNVVPIDRCEIAQPLINRALPQVAALIEDFKLFPLEEVTLRAFVTAGAVMVTLHYPKKHKGRLELTVEDQRRYPSIDSIFTKRGEKGKTVWMCGKRIMSETVADFSYAIAPDTFFQNNLVGLERLIDIVRRCVNTISPSFAIDAHCGVGTFTLPTASSVRTVLGIDLQPEAVDLAAKNAQHNSITNARFRTGHLADISSLKADLVILNPPRQGCWSEDLQAIEQIRPQHLLYISCNPTTLARDLGKLQNYQISSIDLVDLFPMTYHFETVVRLTRR